MNLSKDSSIALNVVAQHGEELLGLRQEISLLRDAMRDSTADRYKGADAERDMKYIQRRLDDTGRTHEELSSLIMSSLVEVHWIRSRTFPQVELPVI